MQNTQRPGQKIKKVQGKKLVKSKNCQKCNFTKKKLFDLFDFTSFFCLDFFKFSGPLCSNNVKICNVLKRNFETNNTVKKWKKVYV